MFKLPQQCGKSFQQKLIIYCFASERIKKKTKQNKQTKTPSKQTYKKSHKKTNQNKTIQNKQKKKNQNQPDRQTSKQTTEQSSKKSHYFICSQKRDREQMLGLFYAYCGFLDLCFLSVGKEGDALPLSKVGM